MRPWFPPRSSLPFVPAPLRRGLVAAAAALLLTGCPQAGAPAPSDWPACTDCDVVLISVDTLRGDHVSALGYPRPTTPEIDRLAARGVLFENAIASSSWTRPTHMSIFTGLHPREHGFLSMRDSRPLEDSVPTLASELKRHGYATAAFHGGLNVAATYGFDNGFDLYHRSGRYFRDNLDDFRRWLARDADGKFFVFLHGYDAHTPYHNDPEDRDALGLGPEMPPVAHGRSCRKEKADWAIRPWIDEYDAAIHRADRYVGQYLRALEEHGRMDRTIVVLLSDHGEEFLEHGHCFHISTLYREVLHVPLVVVAPGLAPRRVPEAVAASVTVAPTILELLGIGDHPFPGPSLLGAALGGPPPQAPVVSETERHVGKKAEGLVHALTTSTDKLVRWVNEDRHALFDAASDPGEQSPLAEPARAAPLLGRLERWADEHPPRFAERRSGKSRRGRNPGESQAEHEQRREHEREMRSLGYLQ